MAEESTATPVLSTHQLGFQWSTRDPFLFCVHHDDHYPAGTAEFGPAASLAGRNMGNDFAGIDGWRMYPGMVVPGFPQHPHRGFETVRELLLLCVPVLGERTFRVIGHVHARREHETS